jgi:hypothetical protein
MSYIFLLLHHLVDSELHFLLLRHLIDVQLHFVYSCITKYTLNYMLCAPVSLTTFVIAFSVLLLHLLDPKDKECYHAFWKHVLLLQDGLL